MKKKQEEKASLGRELGSEDEHRTQKIESLKGAS